MTDLFVLQSDCRMQTGAVAFTTRGSAAPAGHNLELQVDRPAASRLDLLEMTIGVAPPDDAFGTCEFFGGRPCLSPGVRPFKQWRGTAAAVLSHPVRVRLLRAHIPNHHVATFRSRMCFVHRIRARENNVVFTRPSTRPSDPQALPGPLGTRTRRARPCRAARRCRWDVPRLGTGREFPYG
jgi:hypothetical protein